LTKKQFDVYCSVALQKLHSDFKRSEWYFLI